MSHFKLPIWNFPKKKGTLKHWPVYISQCLSFHNYFSFSSYANHNLNISLVNCINNHQSFKALKNIYISLLLMLIYSVRLKNIIYLQLCFYFGNTVSSYRFHNLSTSCNTVSISQSQKNKKNIRSKGCCIVDSIIHSLNLNEANSYSLRIYL